MSTSAEPAPPEPLVRLSAGQCAMFGYGSLLSRASMEATFGGAYVGPRIACAIDGWRRGWDVVMPNDRFLAIEDGGEFVPEHIVYLNVRRAHGPPLNGLLFVLEAGEIETFDRREWIYDRVAITADLRGVRVEGGDAYVYVARPDRRLDERQPRAHAAVRRTYLDIVERGLGELGPGFRADYERSTDAVPAHRVFADVRREGG